MEDTVYEMHPPSFGSLPPLAFFLNEKEEACFKIPETKDGENTINFETGEMFFVEDDAEYASYGIEITRQEDGRNSMVFLNKTAIAGFLHRSEK